MAEQLHTLTEGTLPHQSWDPITQRWTQRQSSGDSVHQPGGLQSARPHPQHHLATTAMADTDCQSCLAGPLLLKDLNLVEADLIPASLVMSSASGNNLPILGAALLRIQLNHTQRKTRQMVYFSPLASKLYLILF